MPGGNGATEEGVDGGAGFGSIASRSVDPGSITYYKITSLTLIF